MRNGIRVFALSIIGALATCAVYGAGMAKSGMLEQVQTMRNTGASMSSTTKVYWKNESIRIEQYGIQGQTVQIKSGHDIYQYLPSQKMALKLTMPAGKDMTVNQILESNVSASKGGKKVGTATIAGIKCNVYSVPASGGVSSKVYVSTDPRFPVPLKSESVAGSATQVTEAKVVRLNISLSDSMFRLPAGTKVETQKMPSMKSGGKQPSSKKR